MGKQTEIGRWDGRSVIDIDAIYKRYSQEDSFFPEVINLMEHEVPQKAATWLLKKHLENGKQLRINQIKKIYTALPRLRQWESKLHILQCMPSMLGNLSFSDMNCLRGQGWYLPDRMRRKFNLLTRLSEPLTVNL